MSAGHRMRHVRQWGEGLAVQLGLRPDDRPPRPATLVDPERLFTLAVAQTGATATVTVEGTVDDRSARWLQEVLLDLVADREIVDVDLDVQAEVVDRPALDRVAAVVGTFAAQQGMTVVRSADGRHPGRSHPAGRARASGPDDLATG